MIPEIARGDLLVAGQNVGRLVLAMHAHDVGHRVPLVAVDGGSTGRGRAVSGAAGEAERKQGATEGDHGDHVDEVQLVDSAG